MNVAKRFSAEEEDILGNPKFFQFLMDTKQRENAVAKRQKRNF